MSKGEIRLPAEWEPQSGVMLAWPYAGSDWDDMLEQVQRVVANIVAAISRYEAVLLLVDKPDAARLQLEAAGAELSRIQQIEVATNDTWVRDYGPITVTHGDDAHILDFGFNGWGLKFAADLDNQVSRRLHRMGCFGSHPLTIGKLVLEGGSIDSDGAGTILTTSDCLLSPNRNPHLSKAQIEAELQGYFGARQILWLDHGHLAGDDTDSHIDILARFAPGNIIVHMMCDDPSDPHFESFVAMRQQLAGFRNADGEPYQLLALPWPKAVRCQSGDIAAASYANFLVLNGAVLVPIYGDAMDEKALTVIRACYPGRQVSGIHALPLLEQGGSLHCLTMQFPQGVLP